MLLKKFPFQRIPIISWGRIGMTRTRSFSGPLFFLVAAAWGLCSAAPLWGQDAYPADLQGMIAEALKANPEIKQMAQVKTAAQEAIRPARTLDNPKFSVNLMNIPVDTWSFAQEPMTQKQLAVSQKFPFPGKLRLRSEVAAEQAQADDFVYQDKINEIRARVIQKYWEMALAYDSYDLTHKNKILWEQVVEVVEDTYRVGRGLQADVLKAQVELGNYLNRLLMWRQKQVTSQADLNALLSKPPQTPIPRPHPLKPRPLSLNLEILLTQARSRPQLQALNTLIDKQGKAVALAQKEFYPDFTIGLTYGFRENLNPPLGPRDQPDFFTSTVMVDVPLWRDSKIRPQIREAQARQSAAREGYENAWNMLSAAIKDSHARLERLSQQIILYEQGIIPQAQQAAAASLAAYRVGAQDFARLYQDQIAVYEAELALQQYLKDFEENWAELEWLVGRELPRRAGGGR